MVTMRVRLTTMNDEVELNGVEADYLDSVLEMYDGFVVDIIRTEEGNIIFDITTPEDGGKIVTFGVLPMAGMWDFQAMSVGVRYTPSQLGLQTRSYDDAHADEEDDELREEVVK